ENDDPAMEDSTEHGPSGTLSYWFDLRNGVELGYGFTRYQFDQEDGPAASDDIDSHEADVGYIHQFGPRTRSRLNYGLAVRNYKEETIDYQIHDVSVGLEKDFSPHTSLTLQLGFYGPTGDVSEDTGILFAADMDRQISHGSIVLGIRKGWDDDYMDSEKRDFTEYWSTQARIEYDIFENLHIYVSGSYRKNSYALEETEDDETYRGRCGLMLEFLRRFSLALDYSYQDRRSDDPEDEYVGNMIMVTLSASRPFKWVR
ncbi:MAG: outer membrane beta-barrel protein, partial [Thermodesulfobacteriota bacterium]|nr:outer membrane beta-barrel protein [Thermodesulfobacteriota bacterium]